MLLINSIDELRSYVKINASTDWNTYSPFVEDAQQKYIEPFVGIHLLDAVINSIVFSEGDDLKTTLHKLLCRALGPFSLALATDELSINFGESGHTVSRTDKLAPASDLKIEKATESLFERGWDNLDRALSYLENNKEDLPDWKDASLKLKTILFKNTKEFQENGLIDINESTLTFYRLRMLILRIEKSETLQLLPKEFDYNEILPLMQAYTASRVAEIITSSSQRTILKDEPPIKFLQEEKSDSRNYYSIQSNFWKGEILKHLVSENLIDDPLSIRWNDDSKKVLVATARTTSEND